MKKILVIAALALLATLALVIVPWVTGAGSPGVEFTLDNVGSEPLRAVIVEVTGRSYSLGDMAPGSSKTIKLKAKGDSHIELRLSNGRRLTIDCYFEPAYTGSIRAKVTPQAVIAVDDKIIPKPY
jgi:hypothetical protein